MEQLSQQKNNKTKIAIVGAGPAGVYCAIHLLKEFKKNNFSNYFIDIFDKSQALRTILPTGNGRCNITNAISDLREFCLNYPRGEKFLYSIFSKHSNYDSINFFNSIGIKTYSQEDDRVFPESNSSKDVKDKLLNELKKYKNFKLINKEITSINELEKYNRIIISTGSRVSKKLLESTKHPLIDFKPSLSALKIKNNIYPQGVSVKSLDGDFIFTHDGISGPLVYKICSKNAQKNYPYICKIKLFNPEELKELIKENPKKSIGNLVSCFIPKSLAKVIVKNYSKNACEVSKKEIESYSEIAFEIIGTSKNGEIVYSGGIDLDSLTNNCKSKINDKLWFCGEVLNIDGFCGGFNLQNCWSSAYVVALDVAKSIENI